MPIAALLDKRLAFVTGKGGVGKTTVAYALGLAAAAAGKRAIVCEIASQERGSALFGRAPIGFDETNLAENLWAISIDPDKMVREYLEVLLPVKAMASLLYRSNLFGYLAAATPGLQEVVSIGKAYELTLDVRRAPGDGRTYDLVIVDAPATGHGVGFLEAPGTFRRIARGGPLADQASRIERMITDSARSGVGIVATAEEMAVNESADLAAGLAEAGVALDEVFANGLFPERFAARRARGDPGGAGAAALGGARCGHRRGGAGADAADRARAAARHRRRRADPRAAVPVHAGVRRGRAAPDLRGARMSAHLDAILAGRSICICAGSGGVGKTTTSAAIAVAMANRGLKVAVLTIDPAKRLADSIGLDDLGNVAQPGRSRRGGAGAASSGR